MEKIKGLKKIITAAFFLFAIMFLSVSFAFADDNIVETPDIRIVIDGKLTTYKDVPLSINQRTMLPLRELLVNLGVPNDDRHIVWNNDEKSVTIYKDSTKIYLKQGSTTAYVNDQPVALDAPVIGYSKNQRTYIPVRFVSECLGKKVIWDGATKTVLITDAKMFDNIKDILNKSNTEMENNSRKVKVVLDSNADVGNEEYGFKMNVKYLLAAEVDMDKKSMHIYINYGMLGINRGTDMYICDGVAYHKDPDMGIWLKRPLSQSELDEIFSKDSSANHSILNVNEALGSHISDVLIAGLLIEETDNPNEILLKGNVNIYIEEIYNLLRGTTENNAILDEALMGAKPNEFYLEMSIDKNTYLINSIYMNVKCNASQNDVGLDLDLDIDVNVIYSDYNGDFEITVPQDILESAIDIDEFYDMIFDEFYFYDEGEEFDDYFPDYFPELDGEFDLEDDIQDNIGNGIKDDIEFENLPDSKPEVDDSKSILKTI